MMENRSPLEKFAYGYFLKLAKVRSEAADEIHILNKKEVKSIRFIFIKNVISAAILGVIGVLLYYIPSYIFPKLFAPNEVFIPFIGIKLKIPIFSTIYSLILAFLEIWLLTIINIRAVHHIAYTCGFPPLFDPNYNAHLEALFEIALEKKSKKILALGINPFRGMSQVSLVLFVFLSQLKAILSNLIIKLVLKRIFGRAVFRQLIDLVGIPVYAFWNGWATYKIIREAKVRIMAPNLINELCGILYKEFNDHQQFKDLLFDSIEFIAISKRNFHHNLYLLAFNLLNMFGIPAREKREYNKNFIEKLSQLDDKARLASLKLLIFGIIIDGVFSRREKNAIEELYNKKIIEWDVATVSRWTRSFAQGKGLGELFAYEAKQQ